MATKLKVIDVSEHQGVIDWNAVKENIDGAILRCGYGDDVVSQDDKQFARNLAECERLGIPRGVYLYSYANTDSHSKSELAHILRLIKGHTFQLPIYIDCEQTGTESYAPIACKIVCDGIKAAGFTPGVYANTSWWNNYLTAVTNYTRWVAQYNTVCTYGGTYDIWQYTDNGTVPGISGAVDMNYCYKEFSDLTEGTAINSANTVADIIYQVYTDKSGWLPTVKNTEDYAGKDGEAIKGVRVQIDGDTAAVEIHQLSDGSVDKLTVYAGKHTVRYRVRPIGSYEYLDWMENRKDTGGSSDAYAGVAGKAIDRVQMVIK